MNSTTVKIESVRKNNANPRFIKDHKFEKLVASIKEFPEMLKLRPIVVNDKMIVLGGNMRLEACKAAGLKEVEIIQANELTEDQQKEFIIKDNASFGEWDWDVINSDWDTQKVEDWGIDVLTFEPIREDEDFFDVSPSQRDNTKNSAQDFEEEVSPPRLTDDEYSNFDLIMLYENKVKLLEILNKVREQKDIEKLEDALMEVVLKYEL